MRSKSLIGEIETTFDERQEQLSEGASTAGPHLQFMFPVREGREGGGGKGRSKEQREGIFSLIPCFISQQVYGVSWSGDETRRKGKGDGNEGMKRPWEENTLRCFSLGGMSQILRGIQQRNIPFPLRKTTVSSVTLWAW